MQSTESKEQRLKRVDMGSGDVRGTEFSEIDVETGKYTEYVVFDLK